MNNQELVLKCGAFDLFKGDVNYNDGIKKQYFIERPSGVTIFPIDKKNNIILIKEYRSFVGKTIIKAPGGGIEINENPIKAAQRELEEETGFFVNENNLEELEVFESKGWLRWKSYFYVAKTIEISKNSDVKADKSEQISVIKVSLDKFWEMITTSDSEFDPFLLYGIVKLKRFLQ